MKKLLILLALLNVSISIFSQGYYSDYDKAVAFHEQQRYAEAIEVYTLVISNDSTDWLVWVNRAICYSALGDVNNAQNDIKKALSLNPEDPSLNVAIADFYAGEGQSKLAIYHYQNAIANHANFDAMSYYNYGTIYFMMGEKDSAIVYLEKSWVLDSSNSDVVNNLGWSYLDTEPEKACMYFNEAYLLDSLDASNVNNLGYSYLMCGDLEIAYMYFQKSESIDSTNSFVFRNYGLYYMHKNDKEKTRENLQKAIELGLIEKWGESYILELRSYCQE